MAQSPQKILITGASGFIGGALVDAFQQSGWQVAGIGRRPLNREGYHSMDLAQPIERSTIDRFQGTDVVLHAAARSSPWGTRQQFERDNVTATRNVVALSKELGAKKLIFLSSSSVYYEARDQFDISENSPLATSGVNLYASSKQIAEREIRKFPQNWCILRPRAVYGVGDSVLFPRILKAANARRLPLLVRKGTPAKGDLLSISNLVDVALQAANRSEISGEFNLTDAQPVEIIPFLLELFRRLNIPKPKNKVSTTTAFQMAFILESLYRVFLPRNEPPITRFGVHVFAYSKTFDVSKMIQTFGPPKQSVEQAVTQFVDWVKSTADPYGLRQL